MKYYKIIFLLTLLTIFVISCSDAATEPEQFATLDVSIRMEVQILDSTYQLYSRPFTKIFFTSFKTDNNDNIEGFDQSDTTSCPNGWGVKLLNFSFTNKDEKIFLGAACDSSNGNNYREISIDYNEALLRIDSTGVSKIIKTFAIYYK